MALSPATFRHSPPPLSTHRRVPISARPFLPLPATAVVSINRIVLRKSPSIVNALAEESKTALHLDGSLKESSMEEREPNVSTILMGFGNEFDPYDSLSTPIYQTATFVQPSATENGKYDYTRSGNPTRDVLERLLAKLEKADRALCFTSGMAALSAVTNLLESGQEIVAGEDIYGGSDRLLSRVVPNKGVVVKRVDTTDLDNVKAAIGPQTRLVWFESPTNPRMMISDIRKISEIAHAHGALVMVDNSIMSPVLSRPIELGADIVMHSATKFLGGHSDLMAGILAVKGERRYFPKPDAPTRLGARIFVKSGLS